MRKIVEFDVHTYYVPTVSTVLILILIAIVVIYLISKRKKKVKNINQENNESVKTNSGENSEYFHRVENPEGNLEKQYRQHLGEKNQNIDNKDKKH